MTQFSATSDHLSVIGDERSSPTVWIPTPLPAPELIPLSQGVFVSEVIHGNHWHSVMRTLAWFDMTCAGSSPAFYNPAFIGRLSLSWPDGRTATYEYPVAEDSPIKVGAYCRSFRDDSPLDPNDPTVKLTQTPINTGKSRINGELKYCTLSIGLSAGFKPGMRIQLTANYNFDLLDQMGKGKLAVKESDKGPLTNVVNLAWIDPDAVGSKQYVYNINSGSAPDRKWYVTATVPGSQEADIFSVIEFDNNYIFKINILFGCDVSVTVYPDIIGDRVKARLNGRVIANSNTASFYITKEKNSLGFYNFSELSRRNSAFEDPDDGDFDDWKTTKNTGDGERDTDGEDKEKAEDAIRGACRFMAVQGQGIGNTWEPEIAGLADVPNCYTSRTLFSEEATHTLDKYAVTFYGDTIAMAWGLSRKDDEDKTEHHYFVDLYDSALAGRRTFEFLDAGALEFTVIDVVATDQYVFVWMTDGANLQCFHLKLASMVNSPDVSPEKVISYVFTAAGVKDFIRSGETNFAEDLTFNDSYIIFGDGTLGVYGVSDGVRIMTLFNPAEVVVDLVLENGLGQGDVVANAPLKYDEMPEDVDRKSNNASFPE